jgi:16S rRNA (guanine527-N7)-methyltransferase
VERARIAALLRPYLLTPAGGAISLSDRQLEQLTSYLDLLLRWNARVNLTAVREAENIVTRHFGESFFAACLLSPEEGTAVADVGSGAGFPGLPVKIYAPSAQLTLIESNQKKAVFLKEAARAIALTDINVFSGRVQDYPASAALVTLRAVERYERTLPDAARLVAPGGRLALLIGADQAQRTPTLLPTLEWRTPVAVPESHSRVILVGKKPEE